ncbi:MAG: hypothetical protein WCG79_08150 [Verrucomicrobiota bacterium]
MTGRWSCVVLVFVLAACRTPQKNVSVYPLADDESGNARHLQTGSDVGETVTGRMNLPNFADIETATNSAISTAPTSNAEPSVAGALPVTATVQKATIHLEPNEMPAPTAHTSVTPRLVIPNGNGAQSVTAANRSIHLTLPAWINSAAREVGGLANVNAGHAVATAQRLSLANVKIPVLVATNSASATIATRAVPLPAVGSAAASVPETLSQPVELEVLLNGAHDDDWRQQQADRQRAAESSRQSERDSLEKALQQFLQSVAK